MVATTDRRILAIETSDADGDPDLTTDHAYDLTDVVPKDDCLIALMPDWDGRIWFATMDGLVGAVDPRSGEAQVLDLGEEIANSLAVDEQGVYVVTVEAQYRLSADRSGKPAVDWRAAYDRGSEQKPGQLSQGSGTTPTLLGDDLLAITDNAEPKMHVLFLRRDTGEEVCSAAVFGDDASATDNSLIAVGPAAVVVENNHGYSGPLSTFLGRATDPGLARVDVVGDECEVALDQRRRDRPDLGREGVPRHRPRLRVHEATILVGRQRVVPHRRRHRHRPPRLQRPHRHRHPDEQPLRRDHPRPGRIGVHRDPGRHGAGEGPGLRAEAFGRTGSVRQRARETVEDQGRARTRTRRRSRSPA